MNVRCYLRPGSSVFKIHGVVFGALSLIVGAGTAAAENPAPVRVAARYGLAAHTLEASAMLYYFDYEEELPSPLASTESGFLPGLRVAYTFRGPTRRLPIYGRAIVEYTDATTDFEGTTQDGTPLKDETENKFLAVEGNVGYTFVGVLEPLEITPYTGLGYRYWERGLQGPSPFTERYSWFYVPVGFRADYWLGGGWSASMDAVSLVMFNGEMEAELSEIDRRLNEPEVDLGDEPGARVELPIAYRFSPRWGISFTPWYQYTAIGRSDDGIVTRNGVPTTTFFEPASRTHQGGVNVGLNLLFG